MLEGVAYIHEKKIMHRDIKPENILVFNDVIKLADFGLARRMDRDSLVHDSDTMDQQHKYKYKRNQGRYTTTVATLWYRCPELLKQSYNDLTKYGPEIDMWSVGCVMAELIAGKPIFRGNGTADQLKKIENIIDTGITSWIMDARSDLPICDLRDMARLLGSLLRIDPRARINAQDALAILRKDHMKGSIDGVSGIVSESQRKKRRFEA